jgi:hypothetical protein
MDSRGEFMEKPNGLDSPTGNPTKDWENWVSQGFLSDECDNCISPENGVFDVRWVRFPKHILLFFTLSQLESESGLNLWN